MSTHTLIASRKTCLGTHSVAHNMLVQVKICAKEGLELDRLGYNCGRLGAVM